MKSCISWKSWVVDEITYTSYLKEILILSRAYVMEYSITITGFSYHNLDGIPWFFEIFFFEFYWKRGDKVSIVVYDRFWPALFSKIGVDFFWAFYHIFVFVVHKSFHSVPFFLFQHFCRQSMKKMIHFSESAAFCKGYVHMLCFFCHSLTAFRRHSTDSHHVMGSIEYFEIEYSDVFLRCDEYFSYCFKTCLFWWKSCWIVSRSSSYLCCSFDDIGYFGMNSRDTLICLICILENVV